MTALLSTEELGLVRLDLYGNVWPVRSTYCRTARDIAEQLALSRVKQLFGVSRGRPGGGSHSPTATRA